MITPDHFDDQIRDQRTFQRILSYIEFGKSVVLQPIILIISNFLTFVLTLLNVTSIYYSKKFHFKKMIDLRSHSLHAAALFLMFTQKSNLVKLKSAKLFSNVESRKKTICYIYLSDIY